MGEQIKQNETISAIINRCRLGMEDKSSDRVLKIRHQN
jgi:hypothetical protein